MSFLIEEKIVIAVSSSAVFEMSEAQSVYDQQGLEAYRSYQRQHLDTPFAKGVAFPFVRRLLQLNELHPAPVEVVVLSKNDPDTGRRFFRSCQHYGLAICRGAFLTGASPHPYLEAFNACLFLSANKEDVSAAIGAGLPAGLVLPGMVEDDDTDTELRVAFDFDGVIADDEAEQVYQKNKSLAEFHASETERAALPHNPGPLQKLISKISRLQRMPSENGGGLLRVAIVTARGAPANERVVTTLNAWNIKVDETFFLGGIEKRRFLEVFKPHLFFDDQLVHLASAHVPSVHIPFGVTNGL